MTLEVIRGEDCQDSIVAALKFHHDFLLLHCLLLQEVLMSLPQSALLLSFLVCSLLLIGCSSLSDLNSRLRSLFHHIIIGSLTFITETFHNN